MTSAIYSRPKYSVFTLHVISLGVGKTRSAAVLKPREKTCYREIRMEHESNEDAWGADTVGGMPTSQCEDINDWRRMVPLVRLHAHSGRFDSPNFPLIAVAPGPLKCLHSMIV